MPPVVQITTGSRLHFGPLAVGAGTGRSFGGIGLMLDAPELVLRSAAVDEDRIRASESYRRTISTTLLKVRQALGSQAPGGVSLELEQAIPRHFGLGSGTQLALAVAQAVCGSRRSSAVQLARWANRGARSAIGVYGFEFGGFLVDAGKSASSQLGTLAARIPFPGDWPILLWLPESSGGLSGDAERAAFSQLPSMEAATTDRLCSLVLREILPNIADRDWESFSVGLRAYGDLVGAHFAPIQGGVWAHPANHAVADWLHARGIDGVAQSSWGPSIAAVLPDQRTAQSIINDWPFEAGTVMITHARNRGAEVETSSTVQTQSVAAPQRPPYEELPR